MTRIFTRLLPVIIALLAAPVAVADGHGDMRGAALAFSCAACHSNAASAGGIPSLEGRDAAFIAEALREFKSGARYATVMGRIAKGYEDDEIKAIAAYLGGGK